MPQLFRVGEYLIYFWVNENNPLEPLHVHVSAVRPKSDATKIWITRSGKALLQHNNSRIPERQLRVIMSIIEAQGAQITAKWLETFGEVSFYC